MINFGIKNAEEIPHLGTVDSKMNELKQLTWDYVY
ncbi:hypothetical protein ACP8HZ_05630 [Francisella noatunensis]